MSVPLCRIDVEFGLARSANLWQIEFGIQQCVSHFILMIIDQGESNSDRRICFQYRHAITDLCEHKSRSAEFHVAQPAGLSKEHFRGYITVKYFVLRISP